MDMSIRLKNTGRPVRLECKRKLAVGALRSLPASYGLSLLSVRAVLERHFEAVRICLSICRNAVMILYDLRHRSEVP